MKDKNIHIGKLIQAFVKENNINSAQLARDICKTRQNIYDLYKRDDVEVKLLLAISEALHHNFFEDIYPSEKKTQNNIDTVFDALKKIVSERMMDN
ncbi:MAG: hypothetical protein FWC39_12585 [Bacteroidetes bacterium]|nr:hypothetical protein [Bacteroidota bacterium]